MNETTLETRKRGPLRQEWYSICSAHQSRHADCPRCQTGRWVNVWKADFGALVYRVHKPTWRWWANRPKSGSRQWLESVFPNLKVKL